MQKALLITGATSDLGLEYLKTISDEKIKIIALYRNNENKLDEINKEYNLDIKKIKCDLTKLDELNKKIKEIEKEYLIVKILHLAAPSVKQERFNKIDIETFRNDLTVQLFSIVEILKIIIPQMKKQKQGKIVIVLSSCTLGIPPKFWTSYVVTKYALLGLIKSLVSEYSQFNIQINGISPSMMETKFLIHMDSRFKDMAVQEHPMKRMVKLAEVASSIEFLLDENSDFINGTNLPITGGEIF